MDTRERIFRHLRQLAPHVKERETGQLLAAAVIEIDRLLKDMETLREMWDRNSLGAWADDTQVLAQIMTPNEGVQGLGAALCDKSTGT